jgi:glutathione synthase/RimK-type ligase-like ATP-grasp enzyme
VVQPLVESVREEGEVSVYVLGGEVVSQAQKVPAAGEIRVQERYGGSTRAVEVSDEAADVARRAVSAAKRLLGETLDYARVDQMRGPDGTLLVSELELTEPGLYLEVLPHNADAFARLVADRAR